MKRFYLESYGCQMNVYDTQGLARLLEDHGFHRVEQPEGADVVLVNTCSVREHAEERTMNRLAQLVRMKAQRPDLKVGVCGCMAQRLGESIRRRIPRLDLVVGAPGAALNGVDYQLDGRLRAYQGPVEVSWRVNSSGSVPGLNDPLAVRIDTSPSGVVVRTH